VAIRAAARVAAPRLRGHRGKGWSPAAGRRNVLRVLLQRHTMDVLGARRQAVAFRAAVRGAQAFAGSLREGIGRRARWDADLAPRPNACTSEWSGARLTKSPTSGENVSPALPAGRFRPFASGEREVAALLAGLQSEALLPAGQRAALDFGCGVGRLTRALASRFDSVAGVGTRSQRARRPSPLRRWGVRFRSQPHRPAARIPDRGGTRLYRGVRPGHCDRRDHRLPAAVGGAGAGAVASAAGIEPGVAPGPVAAALGRGAPAAPLDGPARAAGGGGASNPRVLGRRSADGVPRSPWRL
jgi:hypothetical protein